MACESSNQFESTRVAIEIDGQHVWERFHDAHGNPGGIASGDADRLNKARALLVEALEQADGQFLK